VKRRSYLAGLAALGLLGTAGYAATRDRSEIVTSDGTTETPTQTPGERRSPTATDTSTATSTETPTATETLTPSAERTKAAGGVELTVFEPVVESTLSFENETRSAGAGSAFLLARLVAKNVSDEPATHPRDFTIESDGTESEVFRENDVDGTKTESPERRLYDGSGGFWPDVKETGWVFAEIPADVSTVAFVWRYRRDTNEPTGEETVWRLRVPN